MNKQILVTLFITIVILSIGVISAVEPEGAIVTEETTEMTNLTATAGNHSAFAGNVTELTLDAPGVTQAWQGYFGNVTGSFELGDASGNVMYNWSGAEATSGEVYAANQSSVSWSNIECYNYTAGAASNITALEDYFNINSTDADGIDETFYANTHAAFDTATTSFSGGDCNNTKIFNNAGVGTFDEVLLYDSSNAIPVFTSIINSDTTGFDSNTYDFEMIVPEDGHSGDTNPTVYYFYVELNT